MSNKKYIDLNVDGRSLDLPENNIDIELTFVNSCASGFGKIAGDSSERSFRLPATKLNDEVFENWWNVSQLNTPTAAEEKDAFIQVNGMTLMSGKAQLKSVSTQGRFYQRQGKSYSMSFVGENSDWFEQISDKELGRDLDWTLVNHDFTEANIVPGYDHAPADLYAYCIAKFKDWAWLDTVNSSYRADVFESMPVLFIGEIVKKIFNSIGYVLSSGFWSNPVNARYVLPVPLNPKYPQEFSEDYLNVAATKNVGQLISTGAGTTGVIFDTQTLAPAIGPNPLVLSTARTVVPGVGNTAQYTAPYAGFFQLDFQVQVNGIFGLAEFSLDWRGGSLGISAGPTVILLPPNNGDILSFSVIAELETSAVIEVYANANFNDVNIVFASLSVIGEAKIELGALIDFKYLLRDWKIADFIKGVTAAFNLCWETNVDMKTVTCEPKDDYLVTNRALSTPIIVPGYHFDNTTELKSKLDFEKEGETRAVNETAERQQYQWRQDSNDKTAEAQNDNEEIPFDAGRYDMPLNRFKRSTEENENPFFAPTVMIFDEEIRGISSTLIPLIPLMWPDNYRENPTQEDNTVDFAPRILWFGGQRDEDGTFNMVNSATSVETDDVILPACFFVNYNDTTGFDVSLNWSTLTISGNTIQGQMQRFYLRDLRRMREGKEVEEWMYWDELDISQLSFRPKIFIDGDLYILKEINSYSPIVDRTTKTILIYDLPVEQEDVNRIFNTLAIGFLGNYKEEQ